MIIKDYIKRAMRYLYSLKREKLVVEIPKTIDEKKILAGKVALITGGSSGIGLAIAENFIKEGAKVIIAGTHQDKIDHAVKKLQDVNADYMKGITIDVTDFSSLEQKVEEASSLYEDGKIDILVNSAGINNRNSFFQVTETDFDSVMDVNAKGTFFMSQAVSKYMIKNKIKGHILNISSSSALRPASTPYMISKWAVKGMTLGLADVLLPYGIVVNAIAPGAVATPMLNKCESDNLYNANSVSGRYANPSEIASLATYMVSDYGNLIVGDTYYITGGSGLIDLHR